MNTAIVIITCRMPFISIIVINNHNNIDIIIIFHGKQSVMHNNGLKTRNKPTCRDEQNKNIKITDEKRNINANKHEIIIIIMIIK